MKTAFKPYLESNSFSISKSHVRLIEKEKCLDRGVTIGGNHMDEYMPLFINFFKENLIWKKIILK